MIDSNFFILIGIAVFSMGFQIPLLSYFSRQHGGLLVTVYRNLSFGFTMLPLLFFVTWEEIRAIGYYLPTLLLASSIGAAGFVCNLNAAQYLPVGISNSIRQALYVLIAVCIGIIFLNEALSFLQLGLLIAILVGTISLTLVRSDHSHFDSSESWRGIVLAAMAGFGYAMTFYHFSLLARNINPLVASYFWEFGIGIFATLWLCLLRIRGSYTKKIILPRKSILYIVLVSLTTLSITIPFSFALSYGTFALATGLTATSVVIASFFSWLFFKEKLNLKQILLIVGIVVLVALLRLVS